MEQPSSFGAWLKRRRQAVGLTQDELARRVGCAVATIRKIESDERRPSLQIAELLADHLGLPEQDRERFLRVARGRPFADELPEPSAPAAARPEGAVTLLLAAAGAGGGWWEERPELLRGALTRYAQIVRAACAAHGGHTFKAAGDALFVAFALPGAAIAAAVEGQRAMRREAWGGPGPLAARMALHSGVVRIEAGDYTGLPISRAARLLAVAHGGQVLVSPAAAELAHDQLPPEVALRDLGPHRLHDGPAQHLYQLLAPDLPDHFPPVAAGAAPALPAPATALVGRTRELQALGLLLRDPVVRLVTLTGPGGAGKTRLALQAGADFAEHFEAATFVPLAAVRDPALVPAEIARALGLKVPPDQSPVEQVKARLHGQRALLILDNFEQVTDAAPLLAELLAAAPALTLLVTSRAVLHLSGEREFPVPPLQLPDPRRLPSADQLSLYDGVALFLARAAAARPGFRVTNATAPAVAEICFRLDGLPLAIELAAARIRLFTPQELLTRLRSPLAVLTGGARDLPERHQTLRNTLAWSYDLLAADERRLFARLGVFVGGCDVAAAEAVCADDDGPSFDVLDGLAALIDQSLLRHDAPPDDGPDQGLRVVMLETVREYALEQLAVSGEPERWRERHAAHYLILAETAAPELTGAAQEQWLARLAREQGNLRAALAWAYEGGRWDMAARLGAALWRFWWVQGDGRDWRGWAERVLPHLDALTPPTAAAALSAAGILAYIRGDHPRAMALMEQSLARYRALDDRTRMAALMINMGTVATQLADNRRALALAEEANALYRQIGDPHGVALTLGCMGDAAYGQGDLPRAESCYGESLALVREHGSTFDTALYLHNLGEIHRHMGQLDLAAREQAESLDLFRALDAPLGSGLALASLGAIARGRGEPSTALPLLAESLALADRLDNGQQVGLCLLRIAAALADCGQPERAARLLGAATAALATAAPLQSREQAELEEVLAEVEARLSGPAWELAFRAGGQLTRAQAIAEAGAGRVGPQHGQGEAGGPAPAAIGH